MPSFWPTFAVRGVRIANPRGWPGGAAIVHLERVLEAEPDPVDKYVAFVPVSDTQSLIDAMAGVEKLGVAKDRIHRQALITPACGLGSGAWRWPH